MNPRLHIFKKVTATMISLWMAVLACFMGCTLPALANHDQSEPMANMEHCHRSSKAPGNHDGKPAGPMSCCPLEITVAPKPDSVALAVAPTLDFVLASGFELPQRSSDTVELVPSVWHSGRDTLLKIRLLRI
jgi:hypothetical protein